MLHISNNGNPLITCAPLCLTTVSDRDLPSSLLETCPSSQDYALCAFVAATNIATRSGKTMWSCTSDGITTTDPCSPLWSGSWCSGSSVVYIHLENIGLSGMFVLICVKYLCSADSASMH